MVTDAAQSDGAHSNAAVPGAEASGDATEHPPVPAVPAVLTDEDRQAREAELRGLIELMRPSVQADGGDIELVSFDVEAGVVDVQLRGACSSCAISSATLQGGVERILRGRLDWVTEVTGGVDEEEDVFASAALGRGGYVPRA
jgi:Fe-S cluster biogenesis protein NfuA